MSTWLTSALIPQSFTDFNNAVSGWLDSAYGNTIGYLTVFLLIGSGIYYTIKTGGLQFRMFGHMVKTIFGSRRDAGEGISSFQAFTIGLADRVGTGNIAGVAIAIVVGGPGAVFWMWIVALVGMATGFIESTLGQIFKVRNPDGTFRGGAAFYIRRGLGSKRWAVLFSVLMLFAYGVAFQMIQANTIAGIAKETYEVPVWVTALVLVLLTFPFLVGGVKPVARIAEFLAPIMALVYLVLALLVIFANLSMLPTVFGWIFSYAFGVRSVAGGILFGLWTAILKGAQRGLFSNEAGAGSVPSAAATATLNHPVKQGLIQSMGVFVDTIVVCTCTAFIILMSGIYDPTNPPSDPSGAVYTMEAVSTLGDWAKPLFIVVMSTFIYSTLLGNFAYAESNVKYLFGMKTKPYALAIVVAVTIALGSVLSLNVVWSIGDWAMGLMMVVNVVAIFKLRHWALGALRDYKEQIASKTADQVYFISTENPYLPAELDTEVWDLPHVQADMAQDQIERAKPRSQDPYLWRMMQDALAHQKQTDLSDSDQAEKQD